ncbi:putative 2-aminoethylphosphonate ABC transporter ATP-binding protein [Thalassobaculum sp.]|uniref:putative 2-aminoethylphosphonate ABC transporter ATP-binding protein n=1 Tax=Thalassobaculum sp. TaxID=2022740 RepID=UPI0032EFC251
MISTAPSTTPSAAPFLRVRNLVKAFGSFVALNDISLDVREGEFVCFLGPSGCGKTTLLRAIAGLDLQTSGMIEQAGRDISVLPPSQRDFGIVFQSYALFPNLTIARNVAYGLESQRLPRAEIDRRVAELLDLVGLPEQGTKYPAQLSGGQQQRIALARAIATSPGLLLLDEPLSALDAKVRVHLRHEIKALQRRLGVTTIMVTHDQEEALSMADRIVVMNHGVIDQIGTPTEIYREPATLFVADFIGAMNRLPVVIVDADHVRLGETILQCRPHDLSVDAEATLAIRPEDVVPVESGGSRPKGGNRFDVTVHALEFLGSFWRAVLTGPAFGAVEVEADFSVNAIRRLDIADGMAMAVELPVDRLHVFAGRDASGGDADG